MDIFFHALSAGGLTWYLGEGRRGRLAVAAALGVVPDLMWAPSHILVDGYWLYSANHSLAVITAISLAVALLAGWRVALGGYLHLLIDIFTHSSSTRHLFWPWGEVSLFRGLDWWAWPGLLLWLALWCLLVLWLYSLAGKNQNGIKGNCMTENE